MKRIFGTTTMVYNGAGEKITVVDPLWHTTSTYFDLDGRPTATVDALGNRTTTLYDAAGRVTGVIDALTNRTTFAYEIRSPGQKTHTIRRQIFDLLGPAARSGAKVAELPMTKEIRMERGLNLLGETEILPLVCQLSPDYLGHLATRNMLANRQVLPGLLMRAHLETKDLTEQAGKITLLPGKVYNLALARQYWNQSRGDVYLERVNILSYHSQPRQAKGNELLLCHGFDIASNDIAVRPESGRDPFSIRLEQGVLDTNAESFLMAGCGKVESTAEFFATAESDRVILLYYGSASGLLPIQEKFSTEFVAILLGGIRPEHLPKDAKPPLIATSNRGRGLAQVRITGTGAQAKVEVNQLAIEPTISPSPAMEKVLEKFKSSAR